jgi:hypothetical protein
MQASYRLNTDELDIGFLNSLKEIFKNKKIDIFVSDIDEHGTGEDAELQRYFQSEQFEINKKKLQKRLNDYKEYGLKNCSSFDDTWGKIEEQIQERYQKAV